MDLLQADESTGQHEAEPGVGGEESPLRCHVAVDRPEGHSDTSARPDDVTTATVDPHEPQGERRETGGDEGVPAESPRAGTFTPRSTLRDDDDDDAAKQQSTKEPRVEEEQPKEPATDSFCPADVRRREEGDEQDEEDKRKGINLVEGQSEVACVEEAVRKEQQVAAERKGIMLDAGQSAVECVETDIREEQHVKDTRTGETEHGTRQQDEEEEDDEVEEEEVVVAAAAEEEEEEEEETLSLIAARDEQPVSPMLELDTEVLELMSASSPPASLLHPSHSPSRFRRAKSWCLRPPPSSRPSDDLSIRLTMSPFSTEASPDNSPTRDPATPPPLSPCSPPLSPHSPLSRDDSSPSVSESPLHNKVMEGGADGNGSIYKRPTLPLP